MNSERWCILYFLFIVKYFKVENKRKKKAILKLKVKLKMVKRYNFLVIK